MNNPIAKFIDGTASQQSYIVVARKGNVVLGLKPLGLQDGAMTGVPGKTYFFARVRSASAGDLFDDDEAENGVKMLPVDYDFNDAWPQIKFNKKNSERASAIYGAYIDGSLATDPAKVLQKLEDGGLIEKMADAVVQMVGEENVVVRYGTMLAWLHEQLDPLIAKYKHTLKATADFQKHVEENGEAFDFQQEILKNMLETGAPMDPEQAGGTNEAVTLADLQSHMEPDDDDPSDIDEDVEIDDEDAGFDDTDEDGDLDPDDEDL